MALPAGHALLGGILLAGLLRYHPRLVTLALVTVSAAFLIRDAKVPRGPMKAPVPPPAASPVAEARAAEEEPAAGAMAMAASCAPRPSQGGPDIGRLQELAYAELTSGR